MSRKSFPWGKWAAALLLGGGLYLAYARLAPGRRPPERFQTVTVERGRIADKALVVGRITPLLEFRVKSKIPGIVARCFKQVGDPVARGDPLFEIAPDPTPLQEREMTRKVDLSRVTLDKARADLTRHEELFRQGALPRSQLDATRETFAKAEIAFKEAEERRDLVLKGKIEREGVEMESIIRAPADGTVLSRNVNPGDPVVPLTDNLAGTELMTIADMKDLLLKGTVDEIDVGRIRVGLPARIAVGALPGADVRGELVLIAPKARAETGGTVFDVEIRITDNGGQFLRAGYSANADILISEKEDVLLVPERLVSFESGDASRPFVELAPESPGAPARKVPVAIGLSDGLTAEILSGLSGGEVLLDRSRPAAPPK